MTVSGSSDQEFDLPAIYVAADQASGRGQRSYMRLSAIRLISLLVGAFAGALSFVATSFAVWGWLLLLAFVVAAFAEFSLIRVQPERDWYAGRAIAESVKTLAWRYSVRGEPFNSMMSDRAAEELLLARIKEVVRKGSDRIDLEIGSAVVTEAMRSLRAEGLESRRSTYLGKRTASQRSWYSTKARENESRASIFRYALLGGELLAVVAAALVLGRHVAIDFAGLVAAMVAAGAAWMALKQYSQLTSAYRVAAVELSLQESVLQTVGAEQWDQAVSDAEEAISREHTMWLASRGEEPLKD